MARPLRIEYEAAPGYASAGSVTHAAKRVELRLSAHAKVLRRLERELG